MDKPIFAPLRPLFLIPFGAMTRSDIRRAEKLTGACIVECKNPTEARFLEPPLDAQLDVQARAALSLMRTVIAHNDQNFSRGTLTKWFVDQLINPPIKAVPRVGK